MLPVAPCSILLLFFLFGIVARASLSAECHRRFGKSDFPNCQLLSSTYALHWKLNDGNVTFAVDVDEIPSGWIGLGVSEAGGMRGGDIWVLQSIDSEWVVHDMYSEDFVAPLLDVRQDVSLIGTPVAAGNSVAAVMTRKLKACDFSDLSILSNVSTAFIWAHASEVGYHGVVNRGSMMLTLDPATAKTERSERPSNTKKIAVLMPNITVSPNSTSYICTNFEMPSDRKYHIIQSEFKISSELVHHLIMFACATPPSQALGKLYECESMPTECTVPVLLWAPGTPTWSAPMEAGFLMAKYYALQVHYDNPMNMQGRMDNSGSLVYYTTQLRKYDMAVLTLGQMNLTIPGGNPNYIAAPAVCPAECTAKFSEPLVIVRHGFHMHTLGKSIKTQVVRNGKELVPVAIRQRWDFNHQNEDVPGTNILMPGDAFITTCTYDSSNRNTTTTYGESTSEEMCFSFLSYYPAQDATICLPVAPGIATCTNGGKFAQWRQDLTNQTSPTSPATTPVTSRPASNAGSPPGTGSTVTDPSSGRLPENWVEMAVQEGHITMYNTSKYEAGGLTPYVVPDGCPGFLDAASSGGVEDGSGDAAGSRSGQQAAGPAVPSNAVQKASGTIAEGGRALAGAVLAVLAVVMGCFLI